MCFIADHCFFYFCKRFSQPGRHHVGTGDHGFVDIHAGLSPNVLLVKAGLYDPQKPENWKAYFHSAGGAAFLQLKDKNDKQTKEKEA